MGKSRTEYSIRNSSIALISQAVMIVLSFVTRTIFINVLGASYLGVNGLFTNILMVLSFAELGFGTAIIYALYKPIAENDYKRISAFMNFYKSVYRLIGIIILIIGLCLITNLDYLIKDTSELPVGLPPLWIIFLIYLLNTTVSYFFSYKRSLIIASQNGYIDSLNQMLFTFIRNIAQILVLLVFEDFVLFLIIQIVCTVLSNIFISIKADRLFPFLKENRNEKLDRNSLKSISKNVLAMAFHKLGSVVVSGTDNILISKYIGVIVTGYYSNYLLLTTTLKAVYSQVLTSITASVGNLINTKSDSEVYEFYKKLYFLNAYIAIFFTTCLATLANPFIELLWGRNYIFSNQIVLLIMFVFFINCMRQVCNIFIDTNGLFWQIKWKSLLEAVLNLVAALIFVGPLDMGITGIVMGTVVSCILTNFWWEPYVVYKHALKKPLYKYFILYGKYSFVLLLSVLIIQMTFNILSFEINMLMEFILKCILSVVVPNLIVWIFYRNTAEYKYIVSIAIKALMKFKLLSRRKEPNL